MRPTTHALGSACVSTSAVQPPGSEEKNADYKIKTKAENLVKLGIESYQLFPAHSSPINTYGTNCFYIQRSACICMYTKKSYDRKLLYEC